MTFRRLLLPLAVASLQPLAVIDADAGPRSRPIRTGQTICYDVAGAVVPCAGTGQDGDLLRGEPRSYFDPGNGTIRDKRAGLSWEKLSDDDTIHDKDNTYTWEQAFARIQALNDASYAGFDDWRLPNNLELLTLVDFSKVAPAIAAPFNTDCAPGCTVLTCSCTFAFSAFWSSTSYANQLSAAWVVNLSAGILQGSVKSETASVRAVRGGTVPGGGM